MTAQLPGPQFGLSIGLFGGSFNPAHDGHLHLAQTAMDRLGLDWVWWIVARGNPLKQDHGDYIQRFASVQNLIGHHPRMRASSIEVQLGYSYTIDTLGWLMNRCPSARFVWLMGGDNLHGFVRWKDWRKITESVPIAIVSRRSDAVSPIARSTVFSKRFGAARVSDDDARSLPFRSAPSWTYLPAPLNPASSTRIRQSSQNLDDDD